MSFQYSPFAIPLFFSAVLGAALAWYALRRSDQPEARTFGIMAGALAWWSLCYALNISGADLQTQYFFNRLKYFGVMVVPPLWLILSLQYTGCQPNFTRRHLFLIFLPAMLFLPIVLTDHLTHLWWSKVWEGEFNGQPALMSSHTTLYYLHTAISYLYLIGGSWHYIRLVQTKRQVYRAPAALMIIAAILPLTANVLTQLGLSPMPWGLDAFLFTLTSALMAIAIFRYRFLDIMPIARQALVEQLPDGVIVIDANGRIVDANRAIETLIGHQEDSIVGQPLATAIRIPEIRETLLDAIECSGVEAQMRDVQVGGRVLAATVTPLSPETGRAMGHIIILRDITEQVKAQLELKGMYQQAEIERERLALTISTANDAIVLLDASGQILASNPAAEQILRTKQRDHFPFAVRTALGRAQREMQTVETEVKISESSFHVTVSPVPTPDSSSSADLVLTMHDISHFKQLSQLQDDFIATISHDLRSPLTSIIGYSQIAQREAATEQKRQQAFERIEMAAQRMSDLITDLLDLATLSAGIEHESVPVELNISAQIAIEDLEGAALAKGITIRQELNSHPPLQGDPRLLTQAWRNLIGNAIKYTEKGTITVHVMTVDHQIQGKVSDTGIGISSIDVPYIFGKFYRSKRPYTHGISGTGLGLALAKSIIEGHGGRIWVESKLGEGSTFTFTLPLQDDEHR